MIAKILLPIIGLFCLAPFMNSAIALLSGILIAIIFGNPYLEHSRKATSHLLAVSIVGLGAGMDMTVILETGISGLIFTSISILSVLGIGYLIGSFLKVSQKTSILISIGTAICGGSAIAAIAPIIKARAEDISISLAIIFILNALALLIFPSIGSYFMLTQEQFGLWSALAIHDTSSVVGATLQYGDEALETGTTIKLVRALWIIPVALLIGLLFKSNQEGNAVKVKKPWFIIGFIAMSAIVSTFPELKETGLLINNIAKQLLVLTLFLIGASLTKETIKQASLMPYIQGVTLWVVTSITTLLLILFI